MDTHLVYRRSLEAASHCLNTGDKVLIGLSGGPDSVALARILAAAAPGLGISLGLAHVNHGCRGADARADEAFSRELARGLQLECHTLRLDVPQLAKRRGLSLEEAGRNARYGYFDTLVREKGYTHVATGHHRDDHVEQILMNLIRGSGPSGLTGIPMVRNGLCAVPVLRLLLGSTKAEILDFLGALGQAHCRDATNSDTQYRRNAVRHDLIPFIETHFNPRITDALDRLSQILSLEEDFMVRESEAALAACRRSGRGITLSISALMGYHEAMVHRVLRLALDQTKSNLKRITLAHVRDICRLADQGHPGKQLDLPGQIRVYRLRNRISICREDRPLREIGREEKLRKAARKAAGEARKS